MLSSLIVEVLLEIRRSKYSHLESDVGGSLATDSSSQVGKVEGEYRNQKEGVCSHNSKGYSGRIQVYDILMVESYAKVAALRTSKPVLVTNLKSKGKTIYFCIYLASVRRI